MPATLDPSLPTLPRQTAEVLELRIDQLHDLYRRLELSPVEVTEASLGAAEFYQPSVNAFTHLFHRQALADARQAERRLLQGDSSPLLGIPVSVKDAIWMNGVPATNGSRIFEEFLPSESAIAVERLQGAGAIVIGKTNNPEFCYRGNAANELFGVTRNPLDLNRTPGGSSGGAAAAVALGITPVALGADGGGSIRIPAAFCGVTGFKPTFGVIPRGPGFSGWKTLSVLGPLASSVAGAAAALEVMAGPHASDELSAPLPSGDRSWASRRRLRVAYSVDLGVAALDDGVRAAFLDTLAQLSAAGWELAEAWPHTDDPTDLWLRLAVCESHHSEGALLEHNRDSMSPFAVAMLEEGAGTSAAEYLAADAEREAYARTWEEFFADYDLLLTPTAQISAFGAEADGPDWIGQVPVEPGGDRWAVFSYATNLSRQPSLTVPAGIDEHGLPAGLQVTGPRFGDWDVLEAGRMIEDILGRG